MAAETAAMRPVGVRTNAAVTATRTPKKARTRTTAGPRRRYGLTTRQTSMHTTKSTRDWTASQPASPRGVARHRVMVVARAAHIAFTSSGPSIVVQKCAWWWAAPWIHQDTCLHHRFCHFLSQGADEPARHGAR